MPIYERPTKSLMVDWAKENLSPGQTFKKSAAVQWFAKELPEDQIQYGQHVRRRHGG
jgi:endonuclease